MKLTTLSAIVPLTAVAALLALAAGCQSCPTCAAAARQAAGPPAAKAVAENVIGTEALAALLRSHVAVTVLDARTGQADDGRRLPGAEDASMPATVEAGDVAEAIPDKDALVITYCTDLKCGASHKLAERLRALGYANVIEYREGIEGWVKAELPVGTRCPDCGGLIPAVM